MDADFSFKRLKLTELLQFSKNILKNDRIDVKFFPTFFKISPKLL